MRAGALPRSARPAGPGPRSTALGRHAASVPASAAESREGTPAGVASRVTQLVLDAEQLVVLRDAVRTRRCAGLDLAAVGGHGEVGDRGVLGLAGAVAHHVAEAGAVGELDGVEGLGERADLVDLHQHGVGLAAVDAAL